MVPRIAGRAAAGGVERRIRRNAKVKRMLEPIYWISR